MKKWIAELIGTFALVFFGTGAIVINQQSGGAITHAGIAVAFGLVVMVVIHALGDISGAHINPAVTIAFAVSKRFSWKMVFPYVLCQIGGALLASVVLHYLFPANETLGATLPSGAEMQSFILEIILSFFLMLVILTVSSGSKEQEMLAGISIGSTVLLEALVAGPICGASMNPARSFSPAIVSGRTEHLWIYMVAPISGAILAIPVYKIFSHKKSENENSTV